MSHFLKLVFYLIAMSILQACGSGVEGSSESSQTPRGTAQVSQDIPHSLSRTISNSLVIGAQIVVDGGTPTEIKINLSEQKANGGISATSGSSHVFELEFFTRQGNTVVILARSTVEASIATNQTTNLIFETFHYEDDDSDGFTNLAELLAGTSLSDASSKPESNSFVSSINYTAFDQVNFSVTDSSVVIGRSESINYTDISN